MSKKTNWIYGLLVLTLIFSCNSPKRQKKINDGKLFEKLKEEKGYLNALELKRLEQDFSLKLLDKYDLSGFDEEDTLAYFVRSGSDVWVASCYLGDEDSPFFCLKETSEKGYKVIKHGTVPAEYGECAYELDQLLVRSGNYIFISQRNNGSAYCEDSPLVFHLDGREVDKSSEFKVSTWNGADEEQLPTNNKFKIESKTPGIIVFHVHERVIDTEVDEEVRSRNYDLKFVVKNNTIYFQDTIYK